jgi:hypothetical protein
MPFAPKGPIGLEIMQARLTTSYSRLWVQQEREDIFEKPAKPTGFHGV